MKLIDAKLLLKRISTHTNMHGWHGGSVMVEKCIASVINDMPEVDALVLGKDYSSADYNIITETHKGYQTFRIVKRRGS